ncbi:RNA-directed DNA polymerase [Dendrobium catenatum]|uniref:RNA-directed DNA polymerase n=1 Tax=Dendrobium catenatum TaxID=906689 RepID=A0A2I0VUE2_9ASPA|nr:RNA-directed DNA polymerase [Dendrobium catenatum]
MVDIASSHSIFSFMDGSSGYNQIKMTLEDDKFTAFCTPISVFCYKVMPFGLKNARATYQRVMTVIFDELIHEQVECYVDDLVEFYFDGASSIKSLHPYETPVVRVGLELVFVSPEGHTLRYSYNLSEPRTNNEAEYEAQIVGFELAIQMSIVRVKIIGDSQLIINQVAGIFKVLKPEILPYHYRAMELLCLIPEVTLVRVPRSENGRAYALAKLANELVDPNGNPVSIVVQYRQALCPADLSSPDQALAVMLLRKS